MKYTVHLTTFASLSIDVEIPDDTDQDKAREAAIEAALDNAPNGVCAQCSGWGQKWDLEIGDWDVAKEMDGSEIDPRLHPKGVSTDE